MALEWDSFALFWWRTKHTYEKSRIWNHYTAPQRNTFPGVAVGVSLPQNKVPMHCFKSIGWEIKDTASERWRLLRVTARSCSTSLEDEGKKEEECRWFKRALIHHSEWAAVSLPISALTYIIRNSHACIYSACMGVHKDKWMPRI